MELMIEGKKDKKTPLGTIPSDWITVKFDEVIHKFSSGATPYRRVSEYYRGENLWVSSSELNYGIINDTKEKITDEAIRKTNLHKHPEGTFLMAITGLEAAGTRGRCGILGAEATTNQSCMALYPDKDKLLTDYLFYFYSFYGDFLAFNYCQGTKQQSYTAGIVRILPINLPPTLEEQQAIASALSDVDELIRSLDGLIQKKQAIKKGTMQQLLSGKKRLTGFDGEWEEYELGELGEFKNGINKSKDAFGHGSPFVNLMDVFGVRSINETKHLNLVDSNDAEQLTYDLRKGDVLFVRSSVKPSGVGLTTLVEKDLPNTVYSGFLIRFRDNGKFNNEFKAYCFHETSFRNRLIAKSSVSANTNINQESLKVLKIKIPPSQTEQKAIAQILSDMYRELQTLRQKREKYVHVKQGMMQQILTGRIRIYGMKG